MIGRVKNGMLGHLLAVTILRHLGSHKVAAQISTESAAVIKKDMSAALSA